MKDAETRLYNIVASLVIHSNSSCTSYKIGGVVRCRVLGVKKGKMFNLSLDMRKKEGEDEFEEEVRIAKRRVYWISIYMPDTSKCNVAAAKFFAISNFTNATSIAPRFARRRTASRRSLFADS